MNDLFERIWDEAYSAWRFRWIALAVAAVLAIFGWTVVLALPDRYQADASVFVDTRTALRPALQGLTVEQDVSVQLNYVRQSLLSGERLERIARESGVLPANETDPRIVASTLTGFVKRITLDVRNASPSGREAEREAGSIYSFSYQDGSRERSLKVTETVLNVFIEETLGGKREGAESAQRFLEVELKDLEGRLRAAENRLAEFKKANVGLMPTEQGGYFAQLQMAIDTANGLENDLNVALSRRTELARQLRGDAVLGAAAAPVAGSAGSDTLSRINEAQARLDELLLRFTEKYPDVIAARSTLDELTARREQEVERLRRGDANAVASSGVSTNPVYQSIQQQLNQADVEVASLRGQIAQQRARANDLRKRVDVAPQVEAEYSQLNRDYEVVKAQYTAMLENYERTQLGERADEAGSVRFEVIQPATAPFGPVFPPRTLLLMAVLVAALAAGAGIAWLLQMLRPVVTSTRSLAGLTDLPVLGTVSPAFPRQMAVRARGQVLRFMTAGAGLMAAFAGALILNWLGIRLVTG
jgi:polysaccharide chain length determinant protein (PEP-CTERM system associated)